MTDEKAEKSVVNKGAVEYLNVTKSVPPEAGGTGEEEVEEEFIDIKPFKSETARVRISKGITMNLGNYRSARIDVDLAMPCYPEEVPDMIEHVNNVVETRLVMERDSILKSMKKAPK